MTGTADLPPLKPQDIADLTLGQLRALRDRYQTLDWQESLESACTETRSSEASLSKAEGLSSLGSDKHFLKLSRGHAGYYRHNRR